MDIEDERRKPKKHSIRREKREREKNETKVIDCLMAHEQHAKE